VNCGRTFVHDTSASPETLWYSFAFEHATVPVLVKHYGLSEKTVRTRLDAYVLPEKKPIPRAMVAVMDATKVGLLWVFAVRDPNAHETVYVADVFSETTSVYQAAHASLRNDGFTISAIVSDGRFTAVSWLFPGIPVQMCHFHQIEIVIRYLTLNPKLTAGQELLALVRTLATTDEASFTDAFAHWCRTWDEFLKEKTVDPETGRWHWTHKRVRQARDSVRMHLRLLFTFERYPELNIPNTTNSLDGSFKKAKAAIGIHSGLTRARQIKLVSALLWGDK
jgi:hypothetical protein